MRLKNISPLPAFALALLLPLGFLQAKPNIFSALRAPQTSASPKVAKTEWTEVAMVINADGRSASIAIPGNATRLVVERGRLACVGKSFDGRRDARPTIKPKKVAFPKEVGITGEKPQKFS
jgi:hypothetical protein